MVHPSGSCFVHETYYDGKEGILGIATEPARPCGDTAGDVADELSRMAEGLGESPLRYLDYVAEMSAGSSGDGAGGSPPIPS